MCELKRILSPYAANRLKFLWMRLVAFPDDTYCEKAAQVYAHLTGRTAVRVSAGESLPIETDVVCAHAQALTWHLLSQITRCAEERRVVGLVSASSGPRLLVNAQHLGEAFRRPILLKHVGSIHPIIPFARYSVPNRVLAGGSAPKEAVKQILTAGYSVLMIHTHSDGLDASLGRLTLCSVPSSQTDGDRDRAPTCVYTGLCYRNGNAPIQDLWTEGSLFDCANIRAEILLLPTCWGFFCEPNIIDPRFSFLFRMIDSFAVRCVFTTARTEFWSPALAEELLAATISAATLGEVIKRWDSHRGSTLPRVFLFGDPETPICENFDERPSTIEWVPSEKVRQETTEMRDFIDCLSTAANVNRPADALAVASLIFQKGTLPSRHWLKSAFVRMDKAEESCFVCGLVCEIVNCTFKALPQYSRILFNCPACGIVADIPSTIDLGFFSVANGVLSIDRSLLDESRRYFLYTESDYPDVATLSELLPDSLGFCPIPQRHVSFQGFAYHFLLILSVSDYIALRSPHHQTTSMIARE